jgi:hypothetical protein
MLVSLIGTPEVKLYQKFFHPQPLSTTQMD